ncbi:AraC family transcriptional regulator [Hafnia alvei]|uniref:AraC family transcriptional regulator n=1 Tax=Hafnia alvei TaxID=569 RepID=UPI0024A81218|nr:AraC family transcriptional regulator [Hafnia alvei]
MEPLTDLVSQLKIAKQRTIVFNVKNNSNFIFPSYSGMKVYVVHKGPFFVEVLGSGTPIALDKGDLFILSSGKSFNIYDDPCARPIDVTQIRLIEGRTSYFTNGASDHIFVGCRFVFKSGDPLRMLDNLPEPLIVRASDEDNLGMDEFISHLSREINSSTQGTELITEHLLRIILMKSFRAVIKKGVFKNECSWFSALSDKNIGPVLNEIHMNIGRKWRIDELASLACMSRSNFTSKFRSLTGFSVIEYINRWRFSLAIEEITLNKAKISGVALDLGYESVSAFSNAFKKVMGRSPRNYIAAIENKNAQ